MSGILQGLLASINAPAGPWLYAWGYNGVGPLGDGTTVSKSSPVQIGDLTTWSKISCSQGSRSTIAIKTDGTLWAWGLNNYGALGDGTTVNKSSPVQIGALTTWSTVSFGDRFCLAIKTDGTLWSWGYNTQGQLGGNSTVARSSPVQIGSLTNWSKISCGGYHCISIKTDGTLWSWGSNAQGQLGDGTVVAKSSPVQIGALTNWSETASGKSSNILVKTDGTLWSFGRNNLGQLGDNTAGYTNRSSPVQVGALTTWSKVAAGNFSCSAIKTDGTLWAWGFNNSGQLGDNTIVDKSSPIQVGALTSWSKISAGSYHFISIKTDKTLWVWGDNANGQLGDGFSGFNLFDRSSPIQIGSDTWSVAAGGSAHTVAIED